MKIISFLKSIIEKNPQLHISVNEHKDIDPNSVIVYLGSDKMREYKSYIEPIPINDKPQVVEYYPSRKDVQKMLLEKIKEARIALNKLEGEVIVDDKIQNETEETTP